MYEGKDFSGDSDPYCDQSSGEFHLDSILYYMNLTCNTLQCFFLTGGGSSAPLGQNKSMALLELIMLLGTDLLTLFYFFGMGYCLVSYVVK